VLKTHTLKLAPGGRHLQKGLARALWLDRDYRELSVGLYRSGRS